MCLFITIAYPSGTDRKALSELLARHHTGDKPIVNASVQAVLPDRAIYLMATTGWCSCGSALGSHRPSLQNRVSRQNRVEPSEAQLRKWRREGWSETKIARWRDSRRQSAEASDRHTGSSIERDLPEAQAWTALIRESVAPGGPLGAEWMYLYLNWYCGLDEAQTDLKQERRTVHDLASESLLRLEYGALYRFVWR